MADLNKQIEYLTALINEGKDKEVIIETIKSLRLMQEHLTNKEADVYIVSMNTETYKKFSIIKSAIKKITEEELKERLKND